ncbi:MAG: alpha/beta fold hydrolase [Chloroflexi bacterium]|nr:alpha/beta fold hydrolase [Chloroflexota bacterium]
MPVIADQFYYFYSSQERTGLPLIFVHGAGGIHLYWPIELRRLGNHRVYALDLPGHGRSGGRGKQSISAYAEDVLRWMAAIGIPRGVFIGHSMGAAIAMTIALENPGSMLGLGLIGAAARLRVSPELMQYANSATTYHRAIELLVRWSFSPSSSEKLMVLAAKRLSETRQSVLFGDLLACNDFDITSRVSSIHTPTIVICGAEDKMTPIRHSNFLHTQIKGSKLCIIEEASHMVMLEKPIEVAKNLSSFLASLEK